MRLRALVDKVSWWLLERPVDGRQVRRRVLAFSGLWLFLGGLLAALGFGGFVVAASTVLLVVAVTVGSLWLLLRSRVRHALTLALARVARTSTTAKRRLRAAELRGRLRRADAAVAAAGTRWAASIRARAPDARETAMKISAVTSRRARLAAGRCAWISATARARAASLAHDARRAAARVPRPVAAPGPARSDRRREALRLNARGSQLRRAGEYAQAAEQHRAALAIVRELGDRRVEALTLNDLALALVHSEGAATAVDHLEQALAVLRELGDDEHEGRVTANLAFAHRRQGDSEEAETLLHAALTKLPPDSSAYRRVEEQLRRAS